MPRKAATRVWKRLRGPRPRWFGHPAVIALLAGLLIADYMSIPGGHWFSGSTIKRLVQVVTGKNVGKLINRATFPAMFFEKDGHIELVWDWMDAVPGQIMISEIQQPGGRIDFTWSLLGWPDEREGEARGLYHLTYRETSFQFTNKRATPQQRREMMALFVERYDAIPSTHALSGMLDDTRRLYAQGKTSERTPIPIGYYRNTIALTLLALLMLAFARGRTDLHLRAWKDRLLKRYPPGHCHQCGYDARGLTTCPECGNSRSPT